MTAKQSRKFFIVVLLCWTLGLHSQEIRHRWAGFHIGSWTLLKTVAADGSGHPTYVKYTLQELTERAAIVRMEVQGGGMTSDMSFPIPEGKHKFDRERAEDISFKSKEMHCIAYDFDERHVTVVECPDVPGFITSAKSQMTNTTLVDFEAK